MQSMNPWEEIEQNYDFICGIDEVGRGCFAGPVVACAVIMPKGSRINGVKDSKKLSEKQRKKLSGLIREEALGIGFGIQDAEVIDLINIKQATRLAMKEAVLSIQSKNGEKVIPEYLLIDAETIDLNVPQISIINGDDLCYSISCASIVAKVFRDEMMQNLSLMYPEYDWFNNKGYGTKKHREAIINFGITPLHRKTFLRKLLNGEKHE